MAKVAVGVSSSVAIYKACDLVRRLQEKGHQVQVIMTKNATKFISPRLFAALTGKPVLCDLWKTGEPGKIEHISLAGETELLIIAPATANLIAKIASGLADDFLSTFFLAVRCPVIVAPAMNEAMYLHPRTQANLEVLRNQGIQICEPERGSLACGEEGLGRLASVERILEMAEAELGISQKLKGKKVLITAGPTREPFDPVRFLSNRSSGKMGYELAAEASRRGAEVILVSGPTSLFPPSGVKVVRVETAAEMRDRVENYFGVADIIIMAAAVADFRPAQVLTEKWKKEAGVPHLELVPTADILSFISGHPLRPGKIVVGFAAETQNLEEAAKKKLAAKNLDLIVANNIAMPGVGFESDFNDILVLDRKGKKIRSGTKSKKEISRLILEAIEAYDENLTYKSSGAT
ncbi:MAG: bifunctional phosphopantothenoylcysteine decarboxylase/phosphopantothenate--cysteine ligase CoaBC [Candidatus Aminicenantales bacterium]